MNYWAILVSAALMFGLGEIWYSPVLFAKPWMNYVGLSGETLQQGRRAPLAYILTVLALLLLAVTVAHLVEATDTTSWGAAIELGLALGVGVAGAATLPHTALAGRPWGLFLIDLGYSVVGTVLIALIVTVWR